MKPAIITAMILIAGAASPAWSQAKTGKEFVAMAGAGDLYEKTSSETVLKTTANPKVRAFARMMITDHTKSTTDVKAAAAQAKITPMPPRLNPEQARMVAALKAASGTSRDRLYVSQQKAAHQKALALHSDYAATGTVEPLKAVAASAAPVVQHHIDMLDAM